jgi:hypothetical protein
VSLPAPERAALEGLTLAMSELVERRRCNPARYMRWMPLQWEFLHSAARVKQIRCGNQAQGKSTAALAEVVGRCRGIHPLGEDGPSVHSPPIEAWVICASWAQSIAIQGKLWALLPKDEITEDTEYDPVRGFRGRHAVVKFRNGSIIRIKTTRQQGLSLAGATIDVALFDEPPESQRLFVEVLQRLLHRGGVLLLAYTPVNAPTEYLRELVDAGQIEDHWRPLTPESLIPIGCTQPIMGPDGTLRDAAWIESLRSKIPPHEAPVVIDGEWEMRVLDRYFSCFRNGGPESHVHARVPTHDVDLVLGIDHGSRPGKQIAVLMLVWALEDGSHSIYVLDEYVDHTGTATPADDAKSIVALLARHHFKWSDLKHVYGDRVHLPGRAEQKSNKDLQAQIAKLLKVKSLEPGIRTAKRGTGRGGGSTQVRARWLFHRMVKDAFAVHPRCERLVQAIESFTLRDDDSKDPIDAVVYGLDPYTFGSGPSGPRGPIVLG